MVVPLTVMHVAVEQAVLEQLLHDDRHPADPSRSLMWYSPWGLRVGDVRHALGDAVEVVELQGTRASWAIASRCSTALVEPPSAMTTAIAFSNAPLVMIWRAVMPRSSRLRTARPDS